MVEAKRPGEPLVSPRFVPIADDPHHLVPLFYLKMGTFGMYTKGVSSTTTGYLETCNSGICSSIATHCLFNSLYCLTSYALYKRLYILYIFI